MNYGDLLKRAARMTWRYKVLWIFGILLALTAGGGGGGGGSSVANSGNGCVEEFTTRRTAIRSRAHSSMPRSVITPVMCVVRTTAPEMRVTTAFCIPIANARHNAIRGSCSGRCRDARPAATARTAPSASKTGV